MLTIATDLDMTGAQERWDTFAADPGAITTDAIIAELREDVYKRQGLGVPGPTEQPAEGKKRKEGDDT